MAEFTSGGIRRKFIDFFKGKGHIFVPSASVVPIGDDTLMFTNAGMNQFKDIFLGLTRPEYTRAANSQKCIRVSGKHNDLEEVGLDTYHHTFFEMLGNWSFNDYFKAESIAWAWELFTKVYGIDPDRLWATVFAGDEIDGSAADEESAALWTKVTSLPAERVLRFGRKDNFWEMGQSGPCGPCSEIHIDLGPDRCDRKNTPGHMCGVNTGCARFIELWNLVFIQYNRQPDGRLVKLGANYVDTGAGLERITAVLQNKSSNYDTDLFMPIIKAISGITGHSYTSRPGVKTDNAFRVIADHIRSVSFAIADGVTPSNEARGYVIRRILRRALRFGRVLGVHQPFMYKLVDILAEMMGDAFPEISKRADFAKTVIKAEEESFGRTLDRGLDIFAAAAEEAEKTPDRTVSGKDAFQLYDTFGFPLDLTELMARERNLKVDAGTFDELMEDQRTRARAAQKNSSLQQVIAGVQLPVTDDSPKYQTESCKAAIVGWVDNDGFHNEGSIADQNCQAGLVLDTTCFYAESGGQVGDTGIIKSSAGGEFAVETTERIAGCVLHRGTLATGRFAVGDAVEASVDRSRHASQKNHTATHLLQWALQQVLGDSVKQQGSLVCPDYLRFDFTWPKALSGSQIKHVEHLVREKIAQAIPVTCAVMPIEEAKKLGAMALFNEKYGNKVRVVAVGAQRQDRLHEAFSREFCGGTHVDNTGRIEGFAIIKEESISAGVRRITAFTGAALMNYYLQRSEIIDDLTELVKSPPEQITERVKKLLEDNKNLQKQIKAASKQGDTDIMEQARQLLEKCSKINDTSIIVGTVSFAPVEQLRQAVDMLKKKAVSAAVVLGVSDQNGKAMLLVGVTDDLVKKGLRADEIIRHAAPAIEGGGGGKPQFAQAGGKKPAGLNDACQTAEDFIKTKLSS